MRKRLENIEWPSVMHPDDRKKIEWLNGLCVPYVSKFDFIREIARHPLDHNLKAWYEIFKSDLKYYTFKDFLGATTGRFQEAYNEVENQGEGINITAESLPEMYKQLAEACFILGIQNVPAYSTDWFYGPYHYSNGEKHRRIIMTSGSADLFSEGEMMFTLGHELGHFAAGHKPYHMLIMSFYLPFMNDPSFKAWATIVKLPLLEWYRKSDYTADRIGLLCCQDINVALSTMVKKAGLPKSCYDQISISGFIQQAREFEERYVETIDDVVKKLTIRSVEFPWLVDRAAKLLEWYESGEYQRVLNGN